MAKEDTTARNAASHMVFIGLGRVGVFLKATESSRCYSTSCKANVAHSPTLGNHSVFATVRLPGRTDGMPL
jgi:hypothetical protein